MRNFAVQAPSSVVMVRPHHFTPNPETAADNVFQTADGLRKPAEIAEAAHEEVSRMAARLRAAGVTVHLFEDEGRETPDSVFPNNWFSTHAGGHVAMYPMFNPSRRRERRSDVIEMLKARYRVQDVIDYSGLEPDNVFLEGTGAMVLDHIGRIAYAARSNRTNELALERFCTHFNFEPMLFEAADANGAKIYHTNVIMCVGTEVALVGLDTIVDPARRAEVRSRLEETGRSVVALSHAQINDFAGNALELRGSEGRFLAISARAAASLTPEQRERIGAVTPLLPIDVPTIELAGGSVRCMLAGIHLAARAEPTAAASASAPRETKTRTVIPKLNVVPFVSVDHMMKLVLSVGVERFLTELAAYVEDDFRRWERFDKVARVAAHSPDGVIELMPASDGTAYAFKYVNGHPKNTREGRQTVTAFGVLADVANGYPVLFSEMTILTALRTAATSAVAARHLARPDARTMAIVGNGAQAEFQALAMKALLGIDRLRLFDIDRSASEKCRRNLEGFGFAIAICGSTAEAVEGADIVTTVTADKQFATILTDNLVGAGVHINAVGGDCPGKTELHADILRRADIFVEYPPQTRIEGEIQQLGADHPVTEFWQVVTGAVAGRRNAAQITLFDSVGFATEDFSALRYVRDKLVDAPFFEELDLLADPDEPRDLFGMILRAAA